MKNLEIATRILELENLTLAVVKEGKLIYSSREKGIKPLYTVVKEQIDVLDASVADRVTGKAAAMICAHLGIKELKTKVISDNAIKVLDSTNIVYEYENHTNYIKNFDKTGLCPIEELSLKVSNYEDLITEIENFFDKMKYKMDK